MSGCGTLTFAVPSGDPELCQHFLTPNSFLIPNRTGYTL